MLSAMLSEGRTIVNRQMKADENWPMKTLASSFALCLRHERIQGTIQWAMLAQNMPWNVRKLANWREFANQTLVYSKQGRLEIANGSNLVSD